MKNQLWTSLLTIVLIVVLGVVVFSQFSQDSNDKQDNINLFVPEQVVANFIFEDGLHEYYGTIDLPNPCYVLTTEALVRESFPEQITLQFRTEFREDDVFCAQVITPQDFRILFTASEQAVVNATFNGEKVDMLITTIQTEEKQNSEDNGENFD